MAKLTSVNRNERRKRLIKKYASKYAKLNAIVKNDALHETERLIARFKITEIPRSGQPGRARTIYNAKRVFRRIEPITKEDKISSKDASQAVYHYLSGRLA